MRSKERIKKTSEHQGSSIQRPANGGDGARPHLPVFGGRPGKRGSSMVEVALLAPWIFFLFVGIVDFGFYAYTAIAVQNAARAGAIRTSGDIGSQNSTFACNAVLAELRWLPNIGTTVTTCGSLPLIVTQQTLCGSTATIPACSGGLTNPTCADCTSGLPGATSSASSQVTVTYQSILLIPIPGLLTGQLNLTRKAEMRVLVQ